MPIGLRIMFEDTTEKTLRIGIGLVAFNRHDHFAKVLDALEANDHDLDTILFVDRAARRDTQNEKMIAFAEANRHRFTEVFIRETSFGLKRNIVGTVNYCAEHYDAFIIIEDDILLDKYAIEFCIRSLEQYQDDPEVSHVNLWVPPSILYSRPFKSKTMHCWGWGSWSRKWRIFNDDIERYLKWPSQKIRDFELDSTTGSWQQIQQNAAGQINTWAVFWGCSLFAQGKLCINPPYSLSINIGLDGTGVHTGPIVALRGIMLRNISVLDDEPYEYNDRIKHDLKMHYLEISPNRITMFLLDVLHVFKLKKFAKRTIGRIVGR